MSQSALDVYTPHQLARLSKLIDIRNARLNFAVNHHMNTRSERMDFTSNPHIRFLYNTSAPELAIMGSVQSMKSEWAVIDHFAAAYTGLSVFFVLPKFEMRTTYVQNRINRCVENVPEYKKIIGSGFFDSVAMKNFGRGVIKYVGSNVVSDFKEFPADVLYIEEVDQCSHENIDMAIDRLRASHYQFKRYIGNPTIRDFGIHSYFKESTQREYHVPCTKCGELIELDWFDTVVKELVDKNGNIVDYALRDVNWEPGSRRDVWAICPLCGSQLDRYSSDAQWIAKNPDHPREGLHISMMCSRINSLSSMWIRFRSSLNDPGKLKLFFNSDLGLPFNAAGNRVTDVLLDRCVETDFRFRVFPDRAHIEADCHEGPCSMGVDVGKNLDVKISCLENGRRRTLFVGKIPTRNIHELHDLITRYNIEKVVVDSAPEAMLAQDFQDDAECDVWLCRYGAEGGDQRRTFNTNNRLVTIDRTEALDRSFAQLRLARVILPENYRDLFSGGFVEEMCLPVRQISEDRKGNPRYEWTKGTDHQRHADVYDMLASMMSQDSVLDELIIG